MAGIAAEIKVEILSKIKAGQKVRELSRQYGISEQTIYSWLRGQVTEQVSYQEYKRVLKENEDLKKILGFCNSGARENKKKEVKQFGL